ncbi:fasciclin domain-containing protein [Lacinutrix sp. 5H-3-7-4]|uniref:fasciclin domain-containing protein n=1 Tax=Lacinutrix sp. (strain 5H-3-7-4) TaxID=983544 RepID=UPI00020A3B2D|nr:fasciclin domain-containing protein [Lacinutrix sp. 5H-3-7-4]AEH02758.1 beta-Ig-H3/fasciclin [Lacinutrix sp. 5H-3-7-4]
MIRIILPFVVSVFVICLTFYNSRVNFSNSNCKVLVQKTSGSIEGYLKNTGEHYTLLRVLEHTEIQSLFTKEDIYTLLAPTDAAFEKLGKSKLDSLFLEENTSKLKSIIKNHIIPKHASKDLILQSILKSNKKIDFETLENKKIIFNIKEGILTVKVEKSELCLIEYSSKLDKGFIHVVDTVILTD